MSITPSDADILKKILEDIHQPGMLDRHPWVARPFVREYVEQNQQLRDLSPGQQLAAVLSEQFAKMLPGIPPRRGKRLDTRWGEFGILAAIYFAPLQFGSPIPTSLRDAWGRIDESILLYVNGKGNGLPAEELAATYGLVRQERDVAPVSTLSDWHSKGIHRLAETLRAHEVYLEKSLQGRRSLERAAAARRIWRIALTVFLCLLVAGLTWAGYRARRVYDAALTLREDLYALQDLAALPDLKNLLQAGPLLSRSRQDLDALSAEAAPFLRMGRWLGWVPVYGGDMAASPEILRLAEFLLESTERVYQGLEPVALALEEEQALLPDQMVSLLLDAQPDLGIARDRLDQALALRAELDLQRLSPTVRSLIEGRVDPLLPLMDEGLSAAMAVPRVLGASSDGPQTYLLIIQNEDELRATGGFITGIGKLVLQDGKVMSVSFADSADFENWELPYPQAPWPLQEYMNSPVLLLRDANWSPDFRTSALSVETLYAYNYSHSVDGVLALDQQMVVKLLQVLGPLEVELEGTPDLINAQNAIEFMRDFKTPPAGQLALEEWTPNGFLNQIARALLLRLFDAKDISWQELGHSLMDALDQAHLLVQVDDPEIAQLLAHRGWDGAVRYEGGDYLMVVDSNVGFNKTNAVVETDISYDVDLTNLARPTGTLTVTHYNGAADDIPCIHWEGPRKEDQAGYPIDACYWSYLRVYVPVGAELLDFKAQEVPDHWVLLERGTDGKIDMLGEELEGLQTFGTLKVVPGGGSEMTMLNYLLPEAVLAWEGEGVRYSLHIDKQPGTVAVPLTIRIHLPDQAALQSEIPGAIVEGNHILLQTNLRQDLNLALQLLLE